MDLVEAPDQPRLGRARVEQFLVILRELGMKLGEQLLHDGLFGAVFGPLEIRVGIGHGDIHELGFRQVMDEGHGQDLLAVILSRVLFQEQEGQQGHEVAVGGHGLRMGHPADHVARPGDAVQGMDRLEEGD